MDDMFPVVHEALVKELQRQATQFGWDFVGLKQGNDFVCRDHVSYEQRCTRCGSVGAVQPTGNAVRVEVDHLVSVMIAAGDKWCREQVQRDIEQREQLREYHEAVLEAQEAQIH